VTPLAQQAGSARTMHRLGVVGALVAGLAGPAQAGEVMVHAAWARATIGNAPNSAAYMTLETTGDAPDRLIATSSPLAAKAELHAHIMDGGIARMRPVEAVEVAPGAPAVLEPGGLHIMLFGLRQKLAPGDSVPLTLIFEQAGEVTVEAPVRAMAGVSGHGSHGAMDHPPKTN
jgi:copper(I)-binding protein